jgi:hypothetical protein
MANRKWIQDVYTYADSNVNLVLIGNKSDMATKQVVDCARAQRLASECEWHLLHYDVLTNAPTWNISLISISIATVC